MSTEENKISVDHESVDTCVVGAGYIGYPLALLLANAGHTVTAYDSDPSVVSRINDRESRYEFGELRDIERTVLDGGRLAGAATPVRASNFVITVPTPLQKDGRTADLSHVCDAAGEVAKYLESGNLVIVESTVPPGTTGGAIADILRTESSTGDDPLLAYCPERLMPGNELDELINNSRLIGGIDERSTEVALAFYSKFVSGHLVGTDSTTAELCKLFENAYRDVNIALTNQLAGIAETHGADGGEVLRLASLHPRVNFLNPGIGVGGHCIPVDPWFLVDAAQLNPSLIEASRSINRSVEEAVARRINQALENIEDPVVVLLGATYKPNVTDLRESPAVRIAKRVEELGATVRVYDPLVKALSQPLTDLVPNADLLAILVQHDVLGEQLSTQHAELLSLMRRPMIVDFSTGYPRPWDLP